MLSATAVGVGVVAPFTVVAVVVVVIAVVAVFAVGVVVGVFVPFTVDDEGVMVESGRVC